MLTNQTLTLGVKQIYISPRIDILLLCFSATAVMNVAACTIHKMNVLVILCLSKWKLVKCWQTGTKQQNTPHLCPPFWQSPVFWGCLLTQAHRVLCKRPHKSVLPLLSSSYPNTAWMYGRFLALPLAHFYRRDFPREDVLPLWIISWCDITGIKDSGNTLFQL